MASSLSHSTMMQMFGKMSTQQKIAAFHQLYNTMSDRERSISLPYVKRIFSNWGEYESCVDGPTICQVCDGEMWKESDCVGCQSCGDDVHFNGSKCTISLHNNCNETRDENGEVISCSSHGGYIICVNCMRDGRLRIDEDTIISCQSFGFFRFQCASCKTDGCGHSHFPRIYYDDNDYCVHCIFKMFQ